MKINNSLSIYYLGKRKHKKQRPYWGVCLDYDVKHCFVYVWRFAIILPLYREWPVI